ncbi:hypothetical protein [Peribacillus sp. TH14]|uniref:hypothetical protein n=1 Tax=Peribacillus sp. TH14 TaxID=2798481 RepID=UPI0019112CBD|nr:hypothetical protein [Peribacillus sp. TH14]MBK5501382.1 hypothetical protein [Peribacillus sp. TH14]
MLKFKVITKEWLDNELVTSPFSGTVEEILVEPNQRIVEGVSLFILKTDYGTLRELAVIGVDGILETINIKERDTVSVGSLLAQIKNENVCSKSS